MQLILEEINKGFSEKDVLNGASFVFEQGNIYGLLGRNGAGKTTLFNCLAGELPMDGGRAYIKEADGREHALMESDTGYVFSTPILPEFLTGYEFIKFYMDVNEDRIADKKTAEAYLSSVQIAEEDWHRLIKGYSHGMKSKLEMLCYFIAKPPILLLDEPLTSFDVVVALEMKRMLREMREDHILIFSTHILQLATDLCDEIVILHGGTLEGMEHDALKEPDFEQRIIQMLEGEGDD